MYVVWRLIRKLFIFFIIFVLGKPDVRHVCNVEIAFEIFIIIMTEI